MLTYPQIDPVLIHLGPLQIRWYGLMYVVGIIVGVQAAKTCRVVLEQRRDAGRHYAGERLPVARQVAEQCTGCHSNDCRGALRTEGVAKNHVAERA